MFSVLCVYVAYMYVYHKESHDFSFYGCTCRYIFPEEKKGTKARLQV